jgi:signal transduction histidine kinase
LVDLPEVIEQVRADIAPQARAKGLALSIDLPRALPLVVGDAGRLRQVLLNLASNAVKFTHQGEVCVSAQPSGNGVDIAVRDTGIGITAEAMAMIFEEFRQVDGSMTRRYGGAGLGLAIAKRLVEQMGGRITVESQQGRGSTFTVHLRANPRFPGRRTDRRRRRQAAGGDA